MTQREAAESIMGALRRGGHEAYLVGGCVRDLLLLRTPKDYNVTTDARPERVTELFPHTISVGAAFGVVAVVMDGVQTEVATYRSDGDYPDGRHPEIVFYSDTAREDVLRRDFTINGLLCMGKADTESVEAYEKSLKGSTDTLSIGESTYGVVDYVGGLDDLKNKLIRCIGNPNERFAEDALRMLRACRFAAQLGFKIDGETLKAISKNASLIDKVSKERVAMELLKIVSSPFPLKGLIPLITTGLLNRLPLFYAIDFSLSSVLRRFASFATDDPGLGMAMLLADSTGVSARKVCNDLKLSNGQKDAIMGAIEVGSHLANMREYFIRSLADGVDPLTAMSARAELKKLMRSPGASNALSLLEQRMALGLLPAGLSKVTDFLRA